MDDIRFRPQKLHSKKNIYEKGLIVAKGSSFEREICKKLSLWWSYGKTDDIFWRTAGSGAMAKTRSKKGKTTFGQYGDVQATNPIGQKLIDLCSIELKRGYNKSTFADMIDKLDDAAIQTFESFIYQAEEDSINANAYSWLLIVKRDRRKTLIFMPFILKKELVEAGSVFKKRRPLISFSIITKEETTYKLFGTTFDNFLKAVKPKHIKTLHEESMKELNNALNSLKNSSVEDVTRNDQVFKCTSCDEEAVSWNGVEWECIECGAINDYGREN